MSISGFCVHVHVRVHDHECVHVHDSVRVKSMSMSILIFIFMLIFTHHVSAACMDMQLGHAHGQSTWTNSVTSSMDMQDGYIDMEHGHEAWKCSIGM
jgi:hypothetical protein